MAALCLTLGLSAMLHPVAAMQLGWAVAEPMGDEKAPLRCTQADYWRVQAREARLQLELASMPSIDDESPRILIEIAANFTAQPQCASLLLVKQAKLHDPREPHRQREFTAGVKLCGRKSNKALLNTTYLYTIFSTLQARECAATIDVCTPTDDFDISPNHPRPARIQFTRPAGHQSSTKIIDPSCLSSILYVAHAMASDPSLPLFSIAV